MTITSIIALLGFSDLGMGNGLVNAISKANGKNDEGAARRYVSSGFFLLLVISCILISIFVIGNKLIPWSSVFNVKSELAVRESGPALLVFVICFAVNMPLGVVQRVQMGYQEGFLNNFWQILGSILGLIGVVIGIHLRAGLPWLILAMSGAPVLAALSNWLHQFCLYRPWLFPKLSQFEWSTSREVAKVGLIFFILQLFALIANASDNIVIAQILGASAVTKYSVVQKMFSLVFVTQFFLSPLWPAYREAIERFDYDWVKHTLKRSIKLSMLTGVAIALPLLLFGKSIIPLWTGSDLVPDTFLLVGFSLWVLIFAYVVAMSNFFNSGHLLSRQVFFLGAASIASLILKIILAHYWNISGVIWATVIGYGVFYIIPATSLAKEVFEPSKLYPNNL